jgi:hypothetical protein
MVVAMSRCRRRSFRTPTGVPFASGQAHLDEPQPVALSALPEMFYSFIIDAGVRQQGSSGFELLGFVCDAL